MAEIFDNKPRLIFMQMDSDDICQIHKAFFDYIHHHNQSAVDQQKASLHVPMALNRH